MKPNCNIPLPVNLNCWKHHAAFIKKRVNTAVSEKKTWTGIQKTLLVIGGSQMDIYLGKLSSVQIADEIKSELIKIKKSEFPEYKNWLHDAGKDFKLHQLSDKSIWTLRLGNDKERYIHIHPGRYSPLTIRVKSSTLKTFIITEIFSAQNEVKEYELSFINQIRYKYLNLPPLKSLSSSSGLLRLKSVFKSV